MSAPVDRSVQELSAALRQRGKDREAGELEQAEQRAEAAILQSEAIERRLTGTTGRELQAAGFSSEQERDREMFHRVVERISGSDLSDLTEASRADLTAARRALDSVVDSWIAALTAIDVVFALAEKAEARLAEGGTP